MSEPRDLLEKEVRARVNPEVANLIMVLADIHALHVGGGMVTEALTRLGKDIGAARGKSAARD